jgi:Concanavalin A-like lectin/glucanases superfamily
MSFISKIGSLASRAYGWAASVAALADPYFEYVTLLLPGNGTNGAQNNTFLDASTNNFTITRNGNTTQGTFSPFSQTGWGNYFDGDGDYFTATANAAYTLGTNDHTIECWFYLDGTQQSSSTIFAYASGSTNTSTNSYFFSVGNTSGNLLLGNGSGGWGVNISFTTPSKNTWHHLAIVRNGNVFTLYIDGVSTGTPATYSANIASQSSFPFEIGGQVTGTGTLGSTAFKGYISNFRVVNGTAVYTSAFTPPTSSLTAITNTVLLTCQSNRFKDNSTNNFAITIGGSPSVQAFSPFNPTASWSAATYGGSGYFDGSGDYLSVADNAALEFGSSNFTLEFWYYPVAEESLDALVTKGWPTVFAPFLIAQGSAGRISLYASTNGSSWDIASDVAFGTGIALNAWHHVVMTRSGNTLGLFVDGVRGNTVDVTAKSFQNNTYNLTIGASVTGSNAANTYVSNFRMVVGSSVYDPTQTTLTVPTAPLTAITNTSLLLTFTNAGIYDSTSKNDLETVGSAQISNSVTPKFGSTSIKFNGTTDYLIVNPQNLLNFRSGDFTIEAWIYTTNNATFQAIFTTAADTVSSNTDWGILFDMGSTGTGILRGLFYSGINSYSVASASAVVSTNTWTHVAFVKESGNIAIYYGTSGTGNRASTTSANFAPNFSSSWKPKVGYAQSSTTRFFNGYIQDLRISNTARYTGSTYTVPTAAFPTL